MPTAMVVGSGRSGTTWIAEVIDSQVPCRLMFEPFNPHRVPECSRFEYFQYMRPGEENADLLAFCRALVRGDLRGRWIDGKLARLRPRLRLIKDIRPTPMLRWLIDRFADLPVVYVLRHPCAVVASRLRLDWETDADIERFLRQPTLVADHLGPFLPAIERARTPEEKHAVVWCLSNLVPLRQCAGSRWLLLYYEELQQQPETEIPKIFEALDAEFDRSVFTALRRPSRTTRAGPRQASGADAWRRMLTPAQADNVLAVVDAFGLGHIYGESVMPLARSPRGREALAAAGGVA
jgi:hypothetical protein